MSIFLVLTAAPKAGLTDLQIAEAHALASGAAPARRLSESAAEIPVSTAQAITLPGVDVNFVPALNRRKRLLIADMDSTMIPVECIDEVADFAGVRDEVVAITEPAMRGEISFDDALRARVALLKGLPEAKLQDVYDERVSLNPGARILVQTMKANGAHTALVSGGFTFFTQRVAAAAGFHEHRANTLKADNGALTGETGLPILGRAAKLEALGEIAARLGISEQEALAVGDGANDLAMIGAAGLGAAFRAKPVVAAEADVSIHHGDLTALLYLQGYTAEEFVTD